MTTQSSPFCFSKSSVKNETINRASKIKAWIWAASLC